MGVDQENTSTHFLKHWFPWLICGLGAVFYTYEYFLRIAPNVMMDNLMLMFHINATSLGHLIAFYYYAYAPSQLLVGVLMDHYGPRRILFIACLICGSGTFLFASSSHFAIAAFGRFLMGFGSAFAFVGVLKLATIWLPPDRFALVSGLTSALGTLGASIGEVALTYFVETIGARETIMGMAAVGVVLAIILLLFIQDGTPEAKALDERDNIDFQQILLGLWTILKNKQVWIGGLVGSLLYLPTSAFAEAWGKLYIHTVHHVDPIQAAWVIAAIFFGFTVGGPINGFISDKIKRRVLPLRMGSAVAAGLMVTLLYFPLMPYWLLLLNAFFLGLFYSVQVIVFAVGRESSPSWAAGSAIAVTNGLVMLGGAIFQPLIGKILQAHWSGLMVNNHPVFMAKDYYHVAYIFPLALLGGFILTFFLKENFGREAE